MNTTLQQAPYLREQRQFPSNDIKSLANQIDHAYIDIAGKVNNRSIGIYAVNFPVITGDSYFFEGEPNRQQSLRQEYEFTAAGSIAHGVIWASVDRISHKSYGTYTDGTNWYGVIYAANSIPGQVTFNITPTNIVIMHDAAAPAIVSGYINLEWVSQF